jgi:hypothetical protein
MHTRTLASTLPPLARLGRGFRTALRTALRTAPRAALGTTLRAAFLTIASAGALHAQDAIGVPFVGKNHLSSYTTNVTRDGTAAERAAVFGGIYGRRFQDLAQGVEGSLSLHAGARAFDGPDDGIFDVGVNLAATRSIPQLAQLNLTVAAGAGVMGRGQNPPGADTPEVGHISVRMPISAGLSWDLQVRRATFAPFATIIPTLTSERDYIDDKRVSEDRGWKVGHAFGVSARFQETVFSLSSLHRERGTPEGRRVVFSAGMSW